MFHESFYLYNTTMSTSLLVALRCPISGQIMVDPVILASSGVSYERSLLETWIEERGTDPETGEPLADRRVLENPCLKSLIEAVVTGLNLAA